MDHEVNYQEKLIYAGLDDFTPVATLPEVYCGEYGPQPQMWKKAALMFLFRNLVCNLIRVSPMQPQYRSFKPIQLIELLNQVSLAELSTSTDWVAMYFDGTEKLGGILDKHGLRSWDRYRDPLNEPFIADIKAIYQEHGVLDLSVFP